MTFTPGTDTGSTSITKSGITATMSTMDNASYYQIYASSSGTFSISDGLITKIEFTCTASGTSKYGPGNASANVGTYSYSGSTGTWTGSATSVTISSSAQVRMKSLIITYTPASVSVTGVTLDKSVTTLEVGDTETLTATIAPSNATNKNVSWSSDAPSVATVSNGVVNAVGDGSATITVTTEDGSYTATCNVTVTAATKTAVNMTGFSANATTLVKGNTTTTSVTNDQVGWTAAYTYSSSDTDVAKVNEDGVITAVGKGTATITAELDVDDEDENYKVGATTSMTVDITVTNPSHTVTFSSNGSTYSSSSVEEGESITLPAENPTEVNGYTFCGWAAATIDGTQVEAPEYISSPVMGESDITYYAVFAEREAGTQTTKTDELTADLLNSLASYSNWSGKQASNGSDAVYAGNSMKNTSNGGIQLRSSDNSGLVSTTSGGKVKKVVINWANSTTAGRTLDIYGKNEAYSSSANLYSNSQSTQGQKLGSIVKGTSTELTIDGDYSYIGLRSNNGAMYLASISIDWTSGTPDTYSNFCTTVTALPKPVITLSDTEISMAWGDTDKTLTASATANGEEFEGTITLTSSSNNLTIDEDGNIRCDVPGVYTITASIDATETNQAAVDKVCTVTVGKRNAVVAVSGELTVDLNGAESVNAGTLTANVTYNAAAVEGAEVTWSSSNTGRATIGEKTGNVTILATGEVTFTATYASNDYYNEATGTRGFTITDSNPRGSLTNPYTVAQAIANTPSSGTSDNVYVRGIVSAFYTGDDITDDASYHRYYISDDGTTTNQFLVFNGKGLNNVDFSNASDVQIGDEVIICGGLTTYSKTKEFAAGNYIVELTRKADNPITVSDGTSEDTEFTIDRTNDQNAITLTATAASAETVSLILDNENTTLTAGEDFTFADGTVTCLTKKGGVIIIKANAAGNASYKDAEEVTITITVTGDPELAFAAATANATYGSAFEAPALTNGLSVGINWTSSNETVATVENGEVTLLKAGATTITATATGNYSGSASYTLNVARGSTSLSFAAATPKTYVETSTYQQVATVTPAEADITVAYAFVGEHGDAEIAANGTVTFNEYTGNLTIQASAVATEKWAAPVAQTYTLTVAATPIATIELASTSATTTFGSAVEVEATFADGYLDEENAEVLGTISNSAIANYSFDKETSKITITPIAVGEATLTFKAKSVGDYEEGSTVNFTLTVTAPEALAQAPNSEDVFFNESFDKCVGTGGRDNSFSGSVGTESTTGKLDESWATIGDNCANHCIKLGTSNNYGNVTTGTITLTGNATLTFEAAGWASGTNKVSVTATGATLSGDTEFTLTNSEFNSYAVNITEAIGSVALTFSMKRGFLDEIKVAKQISTITSTSVTTSGSIATYCYQYPLDLDGIEGAKAFKVKEIKYERSEVLLEEISGTIKGGVPFILRSDDEEATIEIPLAEESDIVPESNLLVGTLAPTFVEQNNGDYTNFAYSKIKGYFVKLNADGNTVPANRAYLPIDLSGSNSVKAFTLCFHDADGIQTVREAGAESQIFNLAGQRLTKVQRGINIVNGKKVVIK